MSKNNPLRELARSVEYQTLYARTKELNIQRFYNNKDFSRAQVLFLHYLELYHNLYIDLYTEEGLISEEVINTDLWADSYLVWKKRNKDKSNKSPKKNHDFTSRIPKITFIKGKIKGQ